MGSHCVDLKMHITLKLIKLLELLSLSFMKFLSQPCYKKVRASLLSTIACSVGGEMGRSIMTVDGIKSPGFDGVNH